MMEIFVLNDNRCSNYDFECEHGISLLLKIDKENILFDTGQSDIFIKNANKMGLNLSDVDCVVLSHGDYDHGNGLKYFNLKKKVNLYSHLDIFKNRISKRTGKYDGLNQNKNELSKKFNLCLDKKPIFIKYNIVFLGEIQRELKFESKKLPMINSDNTDYEHKDDSALVILTPKGLVVVSGCSHSGICNIIEYAKKVCNNDKIYAVIGGFHLKEVNEETRNTIKYFRDNKVQKIYLAHCTSDVVCSEFLKEFPQNTTIVGAGDIYKL